MRKALLPVIVVLVLISVVFRLDAQHPGYKQGVGARVMMVDYTGPYTGDFDNFKGYTPAFELFYAHNLHRYLNLVTPFRAGLGKFSEAGSNHSFVGLDLQLHAQYFRPEKPVTPFVFAGAGAVYDIPGDLRFEIPLGIGVDIRLQPQLYLNATMSYRIGLPGETSSFQHGIGFKYLLGRKQQEKTINDIDGDGIPDHLDECPTIYGLARFNGCPDTDGDGIPDHLDDCPTFAGLAEFDGCPDTDADGIPDHLDACPTAPGPRERNGCPENDSDGDGVPDEKDKCPNEAGLPEYDGCPDSDGDGVPDHLDDCPTEEGLKTLRGCPDSDGDGVPDYLDKCPDLPGPMRNAGCPELKKEEKDILENAMRAVQFNLGSANLKPESFPILDQVAGIMKKYPQYGLSIEGHTDNTGQDEFNLRLSENRAKACLEYLISKGIPSERIHYKGYGMTRPLYDNLSEEGRRLNRRVEFIMTIR